MSPTEQQPKTTTTTHKRTGGRHKWPPIRRLRKLIDEFLAQPEERWTYSELAGILDVDIETVLRWERGAVACPPEHLRAIKKARRAIDTSYEHLLRRNGCGGAIFALKNRGWTDQPPGPSATEGISGLFAWLGSRCDPGKQDKGDKPD